MRLTGTVCSGLGRASIFMAQEHYQKQFQTILEDEAYSGTLNVQVSGDDSTLFDILRRSAGLDISADLEDKLKQIVVDDTDFEEFGEMDYADSWLESFSGERIDGFTREGNSFGGATAFLARIESDKGEKYRCAILIPDLTRHTDVIEVIAWHYLRGALDVSDGDEVIIDVSPNY
jgi:CTP-dependent riboflavin kinase